MATRRVSPRTGPRTGRRKNSTRKIRLAWASTECARGWPGGAANSGFMTPSRGRPWKCNCPLRGRWSRRPPKGGRYRILALSHRECNVHLYLYAAKLDFVTRETRRKQSRDPHVNTTCGAPEKARKKRSRDARLKAAATKFWP